MEINDEMNRAIGTLVNQYWKDEKDHFFENLEENMDRETFEDELKCHTFYALIVINFFGDKEEIETYFQELWDEYAP